MKHFAKLLTFGILSTGLMLAQRTPPDPATMVQRQVEHLTQSLSLTTAQQGQATSIFTASQTANQTVMTDLRQAHTSLAAAIKSNDTAAISTLSAQIGTLTGQMTANSSKADAAFYAILTPDQQAKYTPGVGGFGFGGRGPGGPGMGGPRMRRGGAQQ